VSSSGLRYSKVTRRIWWDAKFRSLSEHGKLLFLRLLTAPECTSIPGVIPIRRAILAEEFGWTHERLSEGFQEVFRKGLAKADWEAGLVWLPNAVRHNPPESPNVVRAWANVWSELPDSLLLSEVFDGLSAYVEGLTEGFRKAFESLREGLPKPLPNQEQEQEQEQEEQRSVPPPVGSSEPTFLLSPPESPPSSQSDETSQQGAAIREVFDHWVTGWKRVVGGTRPPKLDTKRRAKIRAALANYAVADICRAIDGLWASDFHIREKHWDIELVCRDSVHTDRFLAMAPERTSGTYAIVHPSEPMPIPAWLDDFEDEARTELQTLLAGSDR
jgi:hypothetical protein